MPKKNNYYIEINLLTTFLFAYCYYAMKKQEEEYNNLSTHPVNTALNWTPTLISSFLLLLTSTTSLILSLNPGRSNFHEDPARKIVDKITAAGPTIVAVAAEAGSKVAQLLIGDRAEAADNVAIKAISLSEQALRFVVVMERLHAHKFARAVYNEETGEYHIRYTELVAQRLDESFTGAVEIAAQYIWRMALSGFLPRYIPDINDDNKLKALATLYLTADAIELIGTKLINNLALATEIIIDNPNISNFLKILKLAGTKQYKVEQPKIIQDIQQAASNALDEMKKLADKAEQEFKYLKQQAAKALHLEEVLKAAEHQIEILEHFFGKTYQQLKEGAISLQSLWRGHKVRTDLDKKHESTIKIQALVKASQTRKKFIETKKLAEKVQEDGHEHHGILEEIASAPSRLFHHLFHREKKTSKTNNDAKKTSAQQKASGAGGSKSGTATEEKHDKAASNEKDGIFQANYISLIPQEKSEYTLTINSRSSSKPKAQYSKEREEYKRSLIEIEQQLNQTVKYKEPTIIIEKPVNKTVNTYQKTGTELLDMLASPEFTGISISMYGDEAAFYKNAALIAM